MVSVRLPLRTMAAGRRLQELLRERHDMELLAYWLQVR
jgi:hypothetical protein